MNFIAQGGISSKNTPSNCKDAFSLALHTNYIEGIAVNVYLTKDQHIVLSDQIHLDNISNGKGKITDHELSHLKHLNFGSKIKHQDIMTLEELLPLFDNSTKMLVIHLTDQNDKEKNKIMINKVIQIIQKYPKINLYLKTAKKDMILYLSSLNTKAQIGITIINMSPDIDQYQVDFYSIATPLIDKSLLQEANKKSNLIMAENITSCEELTDIYKETKKLNNNIYIITNQVISLAGFYFTNLNQS